MEEELIPVNIVIADRTYRLKVEMKNEELIRKTAKLINEKIAEYKNDFAGKDMQDFIAMVILWFATEQEKSSQYILEAAETSRQLQSLEAILDKA